MATNKFDRIATTKISAWLQEMYSVVFELVCLTKVWEELTTGPRNTNDVYAIEQIDKRIRQLRTERNALHKMIHEEPELRNVKD